MDSAEHTSFEALLSRKGGRGLRIAAVVVLVLAALGWLALGARTKSGTTLKSATIADASSRSVQGVIRMPSQPQATGAPDALPTMRAGLKLERTLHTRISAQPASGEPPRTLVER